MSAIQAMKRCIIQDIITSLRLILHYNVGLYLLLLQVITSRPIGHYCKFILRLFKRLSDSTHRITSHHNHSAYITLIYKTLQQAAMGCMISADVHPIVPCGDAQSSLGAGGLKGRPSSLTSGVELKNRGPSSSNRLTVDQLKRLIRIPLTEREVFSVCKSWKSISRNMTSTGIAMFLRLANPFPRLVQWLCQLVCCTVNGEAESSNLRAEINLVLISLLHLRRLQPTISTWS